MSSDANQDMARLNLALKFTGGDLAKAKEMAAGQYNDLRAVKCRFVVENADIFGSFIFFVNPSERVVASAFAATLQDKISYDKISSRDNWKGFYVNLQRVVESGGNFNLELKQHIASSLEGFDLYPDIESGNIPQASASCEDILKKYFSMPAVFCDLEIEPCSSLALSDERIPMAQKSEAAAEIPDDRPEIEKSADFVFDAKVLVSPVKGKYVSDIESGEIIRLLPTKNDPVSRKVAQIQKAINADGELTPLKGRVKEKVEAEKGWIIYCIVAKNILAKITEEENVKIETDAPQTNQSTDKDASNLYLYIALMVLVGVIFLALIYALF